MDEDDLVVKEAGIIVTISGLAYVWACWLGGRAPRDYHTPHSRLDLSHKEWHNNLVAGCQAQLPYSVALLVGGVVLLLLSWLAK